MKKKRINVGVMVLVFVFGLLVNVLIADERHTEVSSDMWQVTKETVFENNEPTIKIAEESEIKEIKVVDKTIKTPKYIKILFRKNRADGTPKMALIHDQGSTKWTDEEVIKYFDGKGRVVRSDKISGSSPNIAKDKDGNINAYLTENKIVFLDKNADVEKEMLLVNREIQRKWKTILKEHESGHLSENGEYIGKSYVKYYFDKIPDDFEKIPPVFPKGISFTYMNRKGDILWKIKGDRDYAFSCRKISKDGNRVILGGRDFNKEQKGEVAEFVNIYNKEGQLLWGFYFASISEIKLTKDNQFALTSVHIKDKSKQGSIEKFIAIDLNTGEIKEIKINYWDEIREKYKGIYDLEW